MYYLQCQFTMFSCSHIETSQLICRDISLVHSRKKKYFVTMVSMTRFYICNALSSVSIYYVQLLSYRSQSINLLSKSIDWFLHEGNTGIQ